jgi:hypothetical protein
MNIEITDVAMLSLTTATALLYVHVRLMTPLPKWFGYRYYYVSIGKRYKSIEAIRKSLEDGSRGAESLRLLMRQNARGKWSVREEMVFFSFFRCTDFNGKWPSLFNSLKEGKNYGWEVFVEELDDSENVPLLAELLPFIVYDRKELFRERSFKNVDAFGHGKVKDIL